MTALIPAGRAQAARLLGRYLATPEGRRQLDPRGRGRSIVPAEWDECIGDVMDRVVRSTSPPATIAILRGDDLLFLNVEPGRPSRGGDGSASSKSSIGMLYQAVAGSERHRLTLQITEWSAVTASPILMDA